MSVETQAPYINEINGLATWARERTSEELQSFVSHRLARVAITVDE